MKEIDEKYLSIIINMLSISHILANLYLSF